FDRVLPAWEQASARFFLGPTSAIRKSDFLASISLLLVSKSDFLASFSLLLVRKSDLLVSISLLLVRKSDLLVSISLLLVRKSDLLVSILLLLVSKSDLLESVSLLLVSKSDLLVSILLLLVSKSDFLVADGLASFPPSGGRQPGQARGSAASKLACKKLLKETSMRIDVGRENSERPPQRETDLRPPKWLTRIVEASTEARRVRVRSIES